MLTINPVRSLLNVQKNCVIQKREGREKIDNHLKAMNGLFLELYAEKKKAIRASLGQERPVLLTKGDELILRYQGVRKVIQYVPDRYHWIKSIAHSACTLHSLNWLSKHQPENKSIWQGYKDVLKRDLRQLEPLLALDPKLQKYGELVRKYLSYLDTPADLSTFESELTALIGEASVVRVEALNDSVHALKQQMDSEHWKQMSVIVLGPRMPREGELSMQYYRKMGLQEMSAQCPHSNHPERGLKWGNRLIYAESIEDEDKAIDLLVIELADEDLGQEAFHDGSMMQGDVLRKATQEYLQTLNIPSKE